MIKRDKQRRNITQKNMVIAILLQKIKPYIVYVKETRRKKIRARYSIKCKITKSNV